MNVVVTGGGTVAPIDEVRAIANASTGRLSAMIAEACLDRGASVWHVHAPSAQLPLLRRARFDLDATDPAAEFDRLARLQARWREASGRLHLVPLREGRVAEYARTLEAVFRARPFDVAFLAMAVSDYEPEPVVGKLPSGPDDLLIRCRPTPKVIRSVRDWCPEGYLVGFKLLSGSDLGDLVAEAEAACLVNRADLTVANDQRTIRAGRHAIHLVRPGHPVESFGPDEPIADRLVGRAFAWADERQFRDARARPGVIRPGRSSDS